MGDKADKQLVTRQRELTETRLAPLEAALDQSPGVIGDVTLADLAVATTLALHEMSGGSFGKYPAINAWFERMKRRPSFAATAPKSMAA